MIRGLVVELLSIATLLFIPETLGYRNSASPTQDSARIAVIPPPDHPQPYPWLKQIRLAGRSISFLFDDIRVFLIVSTFVAHMLFFNRDILLQYISTRYAISLSRATLMVCIRSGLICVLCVF